MRARGRLGRAAIMTACMVAMLTTGCGAECVCAGVLGKAVIVGVATAATSVVVKEVIDEVRKSNEASRIEQPPRAPNSDDRGAQEAIATDEAPADLATSP